MIRPVLTEIGIFLIPFAIYALFLIATRSGLLVQSSWPVQIVAKLVLGSLLMVVVSFILLAHFSGAPPNSTYIPAHIENGKLVSADGNLSTPLEELLGVLGDAQILGKGARGPNPTGMSVLTFGVQVVEVAVDVETGEVRVERVAAAHDVGRIINPLGARSQVEGGIIQGIGHTLSEQRLVDPETGRILTTTLDAYRMPTIADVPEVVCEFVDKPDEHLTSLGSKGLGEPPIVPLAAAIANAIRDATGADVHELPISREEMLRALAEAAKKERRGAPAAV